MGTTMKLVLAKEEIVVSVERKDVRSVHLVVSPNGQVRLSAPFGVSDEWLHSYLFHKTGWIQRCLDRFRETEPNEVENSISSGMSVHVLGRQVRIVVRHARVYSVDREEDVVCIASPASGDAIAVKRQFERWWQQESGLYFGRSIDQLYPIIERHGCERPSLRIVRMETLWGSCSKELTRVNLSSYLYKAPPACIDYVVLHELIHFLFPKHNKDFYDFLTIYMPDWQERKHILDHETVHGLKY